MVLNYLIFLRFPIKHHKLINYCTVQLLFLIFTDITHYYLSFFFIISWITSCWSVEQKLVSAILYVWSLYRTTSKFLIHFHARFEDIENIRVSRKWKGWESQEKQLSWSIRTTLPDFDIFVFWSAAYKNPGLANKAKRTLESKNDFLFLHERTTRPVEE